MRTSLKAVAAAVLAVGAVGAHAAAAVSSAIPTGSVLFSDNSAEHHIDANGNGILDAGDSLRGIFSIDNIAGGGPATAIGAGTAFNELTGIFQVMVTGRVPSGAPGEFDFTFGFDPTFGAGAGVVAVLFDDPAQNYTRNGCATFAGCEATATGGALWATFGLAGGFWTANNAVDTPSVGANLPLTTPLGDFSVGVNFITNNTGIAWNKVLCADLTTLAVTAVDFCGQGGIIATGRTLQGTPTPYDIFNNVDFTANRVPEPASLALFGLALAGLGFAGRRRQA